MKSIEVVHIKWVDIQVINEWTEVTSIKPLDILHAVGFFLHQSPEMYVLCVGYDGETNCANGIMSIPASCVKEVKSLCAIKIT